MKPYYTDHKGHIFLHNPGRAKRARLSQNLRQIDLAQRLGYRKPGYGKNDISNLELGKSKVVMKPEIERYLEFIEQHKPPTT